MKVLFDTSKLIAAMLADHVHHRDCEVWLSQAKAGAVEFYISGHSLAEVYAVLTRLPRTPRMSPTEALQLIESNIAPVAQIITLADTDYLSLVQRLTQLNISGGAVYDGVIAHAAELANVDYLLTLNTSHFQRVWPTEVSRVVTPQSFPPP